MRRYAVVLAFLATFVPGIAAGQVPPPVPALPDAERRTSYSITSATGPFNVGFALYGDGTDYGAWLEVWLNGVRLAPVTDWQLSLSSGASIATAPRPLTNAQVTFSLAQTGTVQIVGARRPRRLTQLTENRGVAARDFNQLYTDAIAELRERWDMVNSRLLVAPAGEVLGGLPTAANRAGGVIGFDATGLIPQMFAYPPGPGSVVGPVGSVTGHLAIFGADGNHLVDGGLPPAIPAAQPLAPHGTVRLTNNGLLRGMMLIGRNGGRLDMWCATASAFKPFMVPQNKAVLGAVSANAGASIRVQHNGTRTFHVGEFLFINGVVGTTELNVETVVQTVVDTTHFDVAIPFVHAYVSGGNIIGAVVGDMNGVRINGVASQSIVDDTLYDVFARYVDAGCTQAEISLWTTAVTGYCTSPLEVFTVTVSFPVLCDANGSESLVGLMIAKGSTMQGNGNSEFVLSYYQRGRTVLNSTVTGSTSGTGWTEFNPSSFPVQVASSPRIGFLVWPDTLPTGSACFPVDNTSANQTVNVGIGIQGKKPDTTAGYTVPGNTSNGSVGIGGSVGVIAANFTADTNQHTMCVVMPFNSSLGGGYYEVSFWGKTPAGVLTSGGATTTQTMFSVEF